MTRLRFVSVIASWPRRAELCSRWPAIDPHHHPGLLFVSVQVVVPLLQCVPPIYGIYQLDFIPRSRLLGFSHHMILAFRGHPFPLVQASAPLLHSAFSVDLGPFTIIGSFSITQATSSSWLSFIFGPPAKPTGSYKFTPVRPSVRNAVFSESVH